MGEARRRKLAGNTEPDKQWHDGKAARKHAKKVMREMYYANDALPLGMGMAMLMSARRGRLLRRK